MTYAELFLYIDSIQTQLPKCAVPVLLRLVAKGIGGGSNEVEVSASRLAAELGMSRDAIRVAARSLSELLDVRSSIGVSSRWVLPADWFEPQRSLFELRPRVENGPYLTRNQAGTSLETRQVPDDKPGSYLPGNQATCRVTRPLWASYQAGPDEKPGNTRRLTRQVFQENQQLSGEPAQIESNRIVSLDDQCSSIVNRILVHTKISADLTKDGDILSQHLRSWYAERGLEHLTPAGPPQRMLAPTLALAPLETLLRKLSGIDPPASGPPRTWIWFFITLTNQLHGIDLEVIREALRRDQQLRPQRKTVNTAFKQQTLQTVNAGARRLF